MKMALVSFPGITFPNIHRVNRCPVMASSNRDIASLGVQVTEGIGNLPKVVLSSVHGSEADIYLFGGCITSWKVANGKDLLFVRPDAVFNGQKPISGGIPHCFPQFGPGKMQQVWNINTVLISIKSLQLSLLFCILLMRRTSS